MTNEGEPPMIGRFSVFDTAAHARSGRALRFELALPQGA